MRAHLAFAIVLIIAAAIAAPPAMAFTEQAIPFVTTCDTIFMQPLSTTDATIVEFNSANSSATSLETLDIDFPVFDRHDGDILALGPTAISADGLTATANMLPFGPVDLAFPSISQTADETYSCQRTYFFVDTGVLP